MTRINTNVSSLQAQINLSRNNQDLQTALTRLSTGLRINSGKDDPAGLIASETLRSDIAATEVGIANSEVASQMIATADSALGQVSSLLIDIQSLVNEAANSGTMSAAQIEANQLQIDSSLQAIDRIGQSTKFQGNNLLDGSLSFITESVDTSSISSVQIDQANFGTNPTIGVSVELLAQATMGALTYQSGEATEPVVLQVGGSSGFQAFNFDAGTTVDQMATAINLVSDATGVTAEATGVLSWDANAAVGTVDSFGADNDIVITANTDGAAAGSYYVRYAVAGGASAATTVLITESSVDAGTGEITYGYIDITLGTDGSSNLNATANDVIAAIGDQETTDGTNFFTVTNAEGSNGTGTVAISEVTAMTGVDPGQDPTANNMLQYQSLDGMRDISYVASGTSTALSIDLNSDPRETTNASSVIDLGLDNSTFKLTYLGAEGEASNRAIDVTWEASADTDDHVLWDGDTLTVQIATDDTTLTDIMALINTDSATLGVFFAEAASAGDIPGISEVGTADAALTTGDVGGMPTSVTFTGGVVSQGTMIVNLATDENGNVTTTANDLTAFIEASGEQMFTDYQVQVSNTGGSDGTGTLAATTTNVKFDPPNTTYTDAQASGTTHSALVTAQFTVTAREEGTAYDGVLVRVVNDDSLAGGESAVSYSTDSNTLLVRFNGAVTANAVIDLINTDETIGALFTAGPEDGVSGSAIGNISDGDFVYLSGGETRAVPDGGATGNTDPPMTKLVGGQNAGSDTSDAMLTFSASNYGSDSFVSVKAIDSTFAVKNAAGDVADRSYGTDVSARINGLQAVGKGLNASLSSSSLQVELGINTLMTAGSTSTFSITGGGAQFQLGPEVVSNQQARIGIMSVSTATLGGINGHGRLYELKDGEGHDLATDTTGAAAIIKDVISQVTGLRGRLGAFQKTTLETNINTLEDTLETLTAAESTIRDADFAAESSNLTRAQILVQSGTKVLAMANQQPQSVLSLIQ